MGSVLAWMGERSGLFSAGCSASAPTDTTCWICLEPEGERRTRSRHALLQRGCSCRGGSGWCHFPCLLRTLDQQEALGHDGSRCPLCRQDFTGELELALARARFQRVASRPSDCPEKLAAQFSLAEGIRSNIGAVNEARDIYQAVLNMNRRALGREHPNTLCVLGRLGDLYMAQGKYAQALPLLEEALELNRRVLGPEHRNTLISTSALGCLHQHRGDYDKALPLLQFDLAASRRLLGNQHIDTLVSLANLGLCHLFREEHEQALELMTEDLEAARRILGPEHPHTRVCMCNLGGLYTNMGRFDKAHQVLDELRASERSDGRVLSRSQELALRSALGLLYMAKGDCERALPLLQTCLVGREKILGVAHPTSHTTAGSLGLCLSLMGEHDEALELLERAAAGLQAAGVLDSHFWLCRFQKGLEKKVPGKALPAVAVASTVARVMMPERASARQRKRKLHTRDSAQKS